MLIRAAMLFALCGFAAGVTLIALVYTETVQPRAWAPGIVHRLEQLWPATVEWERAEPTEAGLDPQRLDALHRRLAEQDTKAFLVVRHNRIVLERYSGRFGINSRHYTASLAKALVGGMSLTLALSEGWIGLDTPVAEHIEPWRNHPGKSRIRVRHLLSHTSGLADAHETGVKHGEEARWKGRYWRNKAQRFDISIHETPLTYEPGTRLRYSNPGVSALACVLASALEDAGKPDLRETLRRRLMRPLGVGDLAWKMSYGRTFERDGQRLYVLGGGGTYTARAAARVGQLLLNGGRWSNRRLLKAEAVRRAIGPAGPPGVTPPPGHPSPGLGWWCNANGVWPRLPEDAFVGAGRGHQVVVGIPSLSLIAVRFGDPLGDQNPRGMTERYWTDLERHLLNPLIDAVVERGKPRNPQGADR